MCSVPPRQPATAGTHPLTDRIARLFSGRQCLQVWRGRGIHLQVWGVGVSASRDSRSSCMPHHRLRPVGRSAFAPCWPFSQALVAAWAAVVQKRCLPGLRRVRQQPQCIRPPLALSTMLLVALERCVDFVRSVRRSVFRHVLSGDVLSAPPKAEAAQSAAPRCSRLVRSCFGVPLSERSQRQLAPVVPAAPCTRV